MANRNSIIGLIASLRESYNEFIKQELKQCGFEELVATHGSILASLYKSKKPLTMLEISKKIGRVKSTITVLVAKLEKQGFVKCVGDKKDRRVVNVQLTEKGWAFEENFNQISSKLITTAFKEMSDSEIEILVAGLSKMRNNFRSNLEKVFQ